jgi:hypothetical protein
MYLRDLVALGVAAGLIAAAVVFSAGWATFGLSGVAGLCIGLAGWDVWRGIRTERYER